MLAIPVFDGNYITNFEDVVETLELFKAVPITIMNDFDVPWVTLAPKKFPKVPKMKVKKRSDDSDEDEDEDEDDEEQEEDEEDEDEEEKDSEEEEGSEKDEEEK